MDHFADRFKLQCRSKGSPVCVGIDPVYERLPKEYRDRGEAMKDAGEIISAIYRFSSRVIAVVSPYVPCIKLQIACFERYGAGGLEAYHRLVAEGQKQGLLVICDAKRGDIGLTSAHYAAGLLADPFGADALTVNGYLGLDALEPIIEVAARDQKGLFVLVRTSNPGSGMIQGLRLSDGRSVCEAMADVLSEAGRLQSDYLGDCGYSLLGAVVGATHVADIAGLRRRMPEQLILVPGYGAQGGTAEQVRSSFHDDGFGAIITASRSVIYAFEHHDDINWEKHVERAAMRFRDDISAIVLS